MIVCGCRNNGFTLLEVMISLAIIGAVVITAVGATNHHLTLLQGEHDSTELTILGRTVLGELESKGTVSEKSSGNLAPLHPDISWRAELMPTEIPALKKLRLQLDRSGGKGVTLVRYLVR